MNNQIYNVYRDPLYTIDQESINNLSKYGNMFSVPIASVSILALGNQLAQLSNPSGSNKTIYIYKIIISNTGTNVGLRINIYRNGSFSNAGTAIIPYNTNFTSTKTSLSTFKYSSSGGTIVNTQLLLTFLQPSPNFTDNTNFLIAMPPGSTLLFEFASLLSLGQTISINIVWLKYKKEVDYTTFFY